MGGEKTVRGVEIRGNALLVEGWTEAAEEAAARSATAQLGEVLLASGGFDSVRHLTPRAIERYRPSRLALRYHVERLVEAPGSLVLVALSGQLVAGEELSLNASPTPMKDYGLEVLPLPWLAGALAGCPRLVALVEIASGDLDFDPTDVLQLFGDGDGTHLVAVAPRSSSLVQAAVDGLRGAAAAPKSGMISLDGLRDFLAAVPGAVVSDTSSDVGLFLPPSPLGLWGLGATRAREPASPSARDLAGRTLPGRFFLEAPIDSGGFGSVYAARQLNLQRDVAVKVVEAPTAAAARLFVNEVRAVSRLNHPNVVKIHQADVTPDGFPFCAMELLSGRSLRGIIDATGPLGLERAERLAHQLLSALGAAHQAGVIHGDVKPDNLVVEGEGNDERLVLIDFGVASLQEVEARSIGGTPEYMAPEQLGGRLEPRSDLYTAALVLHELVVGELPRRRPSGRELSASLPSRLREILGRALAEDPEGRYASASAFAAALEGRDQDLEELRAASSPFRSFVGYSEADEGAFFGRTEETRDIVAEVLLHPTLILTAPSGVGKSSILRAAVVPRLQRLGFGTAFYRCRPDGAVSPLGPASMPRSDRQLVVYDQLETLLLSPAGEQTLDELLGNLQEAAADGSRAVILCVREDFLGRLIEHMLPGAPPQIQRLRPLTRAGAVEAITGPLEARHVRVERCAVDRLVDELEGAAAELGPRMRWGAGAFVYPPHLQLVCASLYERVRRDQKLTLEHLRGVQFSEVIANHLDRLLDGELSEEASRIARHLFAELVGPDDTRAPRSEQELLAARPTSVAADEVVAVLELLRTRGLLLPVRVEGERGWELAHDSLVPRIVDWLDRQELDRRRARELLRHHVNRSTNGRLYLLPRRALREIERQKGLVEEIDAAASRGVTASRLVAESYRALRRRTSRIVALALAATTLAGYLGGSWLIDRRKRLREEALSATNLGRFVLIAEPFDWDADTDCSRAVDLSAIEPPSFTFFGRDPEAPEEPGKPLEAKISRPHTNGSTFSEVVEVRGGPAFLKVEGRGRRGGSCAPSWIRLRWLPGYVDRAKHPQLDIVYPTCAASLAKTVKIPAGPFVADGPGIPPSTLPDIAKRRIVDLPAFVIDRTEVTNAAYAQYASMSSVTGRVMPSYPTRGALAGGELPDRPVANIDWIEARDYCRFLGLRLPTNDEWEKAARGGLYLDAEKTIPNPYPERNTPWGPEPWTGRANLLPESDGFLGAAPVGSFPDGASPYGLLDMAGNVHEWVADGAPSQGGGHRMIRGGSFDVVPENQHHTIAYINSRDEHYRGFDTGVRCAGDLE